MKISIDNYEVYLYTNNRTPDPAKPSVVFVHGAGFDHSVWTLFARHFSRLGWNAIAVDLPGHGRSSGEPIASIEAMAAWLQRVLATLQLNSVALVGHSMGSLIALATAASLGNQASHLVLIGSIAPMPVSDPILDATANKPNNAHTMLTSFSFSKQNLLGGNPNPGMWMIADSMRRYETEMSAALDIDMRACNAYTDGLASAEKVGCPTLMIHGDADRLTPIRATRPLVQAIPDANLATIPGCGHSLMVEAPNEVLDHMKQHLL